VIFSRYRQLPVQPNLLLKQPNPTARQRLVAIPVATAVAVVARVKRLAILGQSAAANCLACYLGGWQETEFSSRWHNRYGAYPPN
jgi:hypothetical protein